MQIPANLQIHPPSSSPTPGFIVFMVGYFTLVVDALFLLNYEPTLNRKSWAQWILEIAFPGRSKE